MPSESGTTPGSTVSATDDPKETDDAQGPERATDEAGEAGRRGLTDTLENARRSLRSALVGREPELALLRDLCAQAVEFQAPQLITVVGHQGTGKTRLVEELAAELARMDGPMRVVRGRATPDGGRLDAVISLLRDRFQVQPGDTSEDARARFEAEIARALGADAAGESAHLLGALIGLDYPGSRLVRIAGQTPGLEDQLRYALLGRFIEEDARAQPLLLWLDDMHWADDESLALLRSLAQGLAGSPLVMISCARPEMLVKSPDWGGFAAVGHERVDLRNLDPEPAKAMFRNLLARCDDIPEDVVDDALDVTGGNPAFLVGLTGQYLLDGAITIADDAPERWRLDADQAFEIELPVSVEAAVAARISALSLEERDVLEKGAVFGNVFWAGAVVSLARVENVMPLRPGARSRLPQRLPTHDLTYPWNFDNDELGQRVMKILESLVERDYLLEVGAEDSSLHGEFELVFKHNLERELIVKSTEPDRLSRYYRLAAHWLETRLAGRSEEQLEALAQLYERGGDRHRASHCYLSGGDMARARFANQEAVELYTRGLAMLDENDALARFTALHNLGDVFDRVGDTDAAIENFRDMLRLAWLFGDQAKAGAAHGRLGRIFRRLGEYDRAMRHFVEAHERFSKAADERGIASMLDDMGQVHWMRGAYAQALEFHRQALSIRRAIGDQRSIALTLANIGRVHHDSGSFKAAITQFREALDIRRSIDDSIGVVRSLCDLGKVHTADGNPSMAVGLLDEAYELAVSMGDKQAQTAVLAHLGECKGAMGLADDAVAHLSAAIELATAIGDRVTLSECSAVLSEVHLRRGAFDEAYDTAQRALHIAEAVGSRVHVGSAYRALAEAAFARSRTDEDMAQVEDYFNHAVSVFAGMKNEVELARAYRAFAIYRERTNAHEDAAKLRRRADEIFRRLRGATAV